MSKYKLTYKPFGSSAVLIEWPARMDENIIRDIAAFDATLEKGGHILDSIIAYHSLTIKFNNEIDFDAEVDDLKELYKDIRQQKEQEVRRWHVPVCYDPDFGLDLKDMARMKKLSVNKLIQLHTERNYLVYFIGFQPGFLYLGGLNKKLRTPRKANPRLRVTKGSVGIGGEQTGIYPGTSAGGWNILGKSPIDFFDRTSPEPCFAQPGDRIKFKAVDRDEYQEIELAVQDGSYELKYQIL